MSQKIIQEYQDFVQKEQDELTLQKNYLSEASNILQSNDLTGSYQAFMNCLEQYPSYLFKKEKEFMFFFAKANEKLNVITEDGGKFHDPSVMINLEDLLFKVDIYHTVHGVYELNFSYQETDMALRIEIDMPKKMLSILTQDLLNLLVIGRAKSNLVHYLTDLSKLFETIGFEIKRETTTNIDPFLMFDKLVFQRVPHFDDQDFDQLFIAMEGQGDMVSLPDKNGVHLTLDDENEIFITSSQAEDVCDIEIKHHNGQIYLFDLLAAFPYVEQLFTGQVIFPEDM